MDAITLTAIPATQPSVKTNEPTEEVKRSNKGPVRPKEAEKDNKGAKGAGRHDGKRQQGDRLGLDPAVITSSVNVISTPTGGQRWSNRTYRVSTSRSPLVHSLSTQTTVLAQRL